MEGFVGVVTSKKSLSTEKKLVLLLLLMGNFIIVVAAIFLTKNKSQPINPRASEPTNNFAEAQTSIPRRPKMSVEEKTNKMRGLGIEVVTTEPLVERIAINNSIDKVSVSVREESAVMWTINDTESHVLVFSDGLQTPPLTRGDVYSRHISGDRTVSYTDKNNTSLTGRIDISNN